VSVPFPADLRGLAVPADRKDPRLRWTKQSWTWLLGHTGGGQEGGRFPGGLPWFAHRTGACPHPSPGRCSGCGPEQLGDSSEFGPELSLARLDKAFPLTPTTISRVGATVGGAAGEGLPVHHMFFLGGAYPSAVFGETQPAFWELKLQERWGRAVQVFRLSLRREIRDGIYATAGINAGNAFPTWEFSPKDYTAGWELSLGAGTPIGPVEATLHGRSLEEWPMLDLNVGFIF